MELDAIAEPDLDRIAKLGGADLVVGILDSPHAEQGNGQDVHRAVSMVREALTKLPGIKSAVVVCNNGAGPVAKDVPLDDQILAVFPCNLAASRPGATLAQSRFDTYQCILGTGQKVGARACALVTSPSGLVTSQWIYRLVHPVLELGFELVVPRYSRHRMEGLLNRSVLAPLHRAVYGPHLENPLGPDFGISGQLLQRVLGANLRGNSLVSLVPTAAAAGLPICESHLGARTQPAIDPANLSSLLADVLGPVFLEMEKQASFWQRVRSSAAVPEFGSFEVPSGEAPVVDVRPMIESFHLGTQNLLDVWGLLLPPTTLLELRKLSRLAPDQLRMADDLWVRIVYDFALGHRLRTINRDHLLRSITPLYLGWIASYSLELQTAGPGEVATRMERLSIAFETNKPYLVSRWRWPDRFNP